MPDLPATLAAAVPPVAGNFPLKWFIIGLVVFVVVVLLESWRQTRQMKRRGVKSSGRGNLMGTGILELQGHLQPDRKVESMKEEIRDKQRANPAYQMGVVGDNKDDED